MRARAQRFLLLFVALVFPALAARKPPEKLLVLTNVNLVDVVSGSIDRHVNVVIKGDKVQTIAKVALIGNLGHNRTIVINANGKYLIPGLWDMHAHSAGGPAAPWNENVIYPLYVANGITGIRDMGGDLKLLQDRRQKIQHGELVGPEIVFAGPFLVAGPADASSRGVHSTDEARQVVGELKTTGVDFIKVLSDLPRETYLALATECRQQKIALAGHVPDSLSAEEAANAGQKSIEHLSGIALACSPREDELRRKKMDALARNDGAAYSAASREAESTYDATKAARLFAQFRETGTWQVPTLVWWQTQTALDNPALTKSNVLRYAPAWARQQWEAQAPTPPAVIAGFKTSFQHDLALVHVMREAGVQFLSGTDSPDPFLLPGWSLHSELELLVRAGFTPLDALRTATVNVGTFLGRQDAGTIDAKHPANLVLLEANPLDDIRNTRKIAAVILRGHYYSRSDLDKMLAGVEAIAKAEEKSK
jgi:imidazolonepropionase-like amidohydrolase